MQQVVPSEVRIRIFANLNEILCINKLHASMWILGLEY